MKVKWLTSLKAEMYVQDTSNNLANRATEDKRLRWIWNVQDISDKANRDEKFVSWLWNVQDISENLANRATKDERL